MRSLILLLVKFVILPIQLLYMEDIYHAAALQEGTTLEEISDVGLDALHLTLAIAYLEETSKTSTIQMEVTTIQMEARDRVMNALQMESSVHQLQLNA